MEDFQRIICCVKKFSYVRRCIKMYYKLKYEMSTKGDTYRGKENFEGITCRGKKWQQDFICGNSKR